MTKAAYIKKCLGCRETLPGKTGMPCERSGNCRYARALKEPSGEILLPYVCDVNALCADALRLIEELEERVAIVEEGKTAEAEMEGGGNTWFFVCEECHTALNSTDKYCRQCGRRLIWA